MKTSPLSPAEHTRIILISPISSRGPRDLTNLQHLGGAKIVAAMAKDERKELEVSDRLHGQQ